MLEGAKDLKIGWTLKAGSFASRTLQALHVKVSCTPQKIQKRHREELRASFQCSRSSVPRMSQPGLVRMLHREQWG